MPVIVDSQEDPRPEDFLIVDMINRRMVGESQADYITVQAIVSWARRGIDRTVRTGNRIARAMLIPFIVD